MRDFDAVFIVTRAQPPCAALHDAAAVARRHGRRVVVLALTGDRGPSPAAPWNAAEVHAMLALSTEAGIEYQCVQDVVYDRARRAAALARAALAVLGSVGHIACIADDALTESLPAGWRRIARTYGFAAAEAALREQLFAEQAPDWTAIARETGAALSVWLRDWTMQERARRLRLEARFLRQFRARWAAAPYPPVFVTVDGIVTWRDQILLVRRGRDPGRGLWALPGGFVDQQETLADAARREVGEETGLELVAVECRGQRTFDAPGRALRGRTITHAYHYDVSGRAQRPQVRGGDDASAAAWRPLRALAAAELFEDHYAILQVFPALR